VVDETWIGQAQAGLPELPRARRARLLVEYGIARSEAETIASARELADYYEDLARRGLPKLAARWVTGEMLRWMKERAISLEDAGSFPVNPARFDGLLKMLEAGEISAASAKEVFAAMIESPADAAEIVAGKGLGRMRDARALEEAVAEIIAGNPSQVALYRSGKTQTFGWFVGRVMKKTGGRADPAEVRDAVTRALSGSGR
jgi:aspartyl-tRNA(Asn)/glutamyl-tRNA(Gln) amidotransferase subunit B